MEESLQLWKGMTAKQAQVSQMIPAPSSPKFHPILQKVLVSENTIRPTSLTAQSSQEDEAALSFLFYIWSCNTE